MVEVVCEYQGDLHTSCTHGPSGAHLETDAPVDNQGRGEAFSPTDLVATALGSCMLTIMGIVARRHELSLEGARVTVEKTMTAAPVRRIATLDVRFQLPGTVPEEQRIVLRRAAESCPVHASLHADIQVRISYEWK